MTPKDQQTSAVRWFADLNNNEVPSGGGKNASLGEMIRPLTKQKARVPDGFATTAEAYWQFLEANKIKEKVATLLDKLRDDKIKLDEAVKEMIREVIKKAHKAKRKVGICGQALSDDPEFAEFLVDAGIDSISLNPDSVVETLKRVAQEENKKKKAPRKRGTNSSRRKGTR